MKKCLKFVSVVLSIMLAFGCVSLPVLADDTAQTSAFNAEFNENYTNAIPIINADGNKDWTFSVSYHQWKADGYACPSDSTENCGRKSMAFPFGKDAKLTNVQRILFSNPSWLEEGYGFKSDTLNNIKDTGVLKLSLCISAGNDTDGNAVPTQLSDIKFWFTNKSYKESAKYSVSGLSANEWHDIYIPLSAFNLGNIIGEKRAIEFDFITSKAKNVEKYDICIAELGIYQRNMALNEVEVSDGKANLSWKNSVSAKKGTVAAYKVYRDDILLTTINDVNTLTYTDTTATADDVHEYYVDAVDANGVSLAASNKRYPVVYGKDTVKKVSIYTNTATSAMVGKTHNVSKGNQLKFLKRADASMPVPEGEIALGTTVSKYDGNAYILEPSIGDAIDLSKVDQNGYLTFKVYINDYENREGKTPIKDLKVSLQKKGWTSCGDYSVPASQITVDKWQYIKIPMSSFSECMELREIQFNYSDSCGYGYKLYVQDIAFTMPKVNRDETEVKDGDSIVTTVEKGKTYSANITAYNHSDAAVTPTFVAALYNGNALADVAVISNQAISADGEHTFTHSFVVPNEDGNYEIKAFLFDDFNNLTPYPFVK